MFAFSSDFSWRCGESDSFCGEERFWVSLAEGFEELEFFDGFRAELGELCGCVDLELVYDVVVIEVFVCVFFEIFGEAFDIFGMDSDTRGHFVSAEGVEMFCAGFDCT